MASTTDMLLDLHNSLRKNHGVPPLTIDPELCRIAERYARNLANEKDAHIDLSNLGVNIFERKIPWNEKNEPNLDKVAIKQAINCWYDQKKEYNWSDPSSSSVFAENFYEIVWKATQRMGVAVEMSRDNIIFIVVIYARDGSDMTNKGHQENVLP